MKKFMATTLMAAVLVMSLSISNFPKALASGKVVLDSCDSLTNGTMIHTGWSATTDGMTLNRSDPMEGAGCFSMVTFYDYYIQTGKYFAQPINSGFSGKTSGGALSAWIYVDDAQKLLKAAQSTTPGRGAYISISSSGSASLAPENNYIQFELDGSFTSGVWNHVILPLDSGAAVGNINLAAINAYYIYVGCEDNFTGIQMTIDDINFIPYTGTGGVVETKSVLETKTTTILDNCDGDAAVPQNSMDKIEGTSCYTMNVPVDGMGVLAKPLEKSVNSGFSNTSKNIGAISLWLYVEDAAKFASASTSYLEISSNKLANGTGALSWSLVSLKDDLESGKWNRLVLPLSSATESTGMNLSDIQMWRLVNWMPKQEVALMIDDLKFIPFAPNADSGVVETVPLVSLKGTVVLDNCEDASNLGQETTNQLQGEACYKVDIAANNSGILAKTLETGVNSKFTGFSKKVGALSLWVYIDDVDAFATATTSYVEISSGTAGDGTYALSWSLAGLTDDLVSGKWNRLVLPFSSATDSGIVLSEIKMWRMIIWELKQDLSVMIDALNFVSFAPGATSGVVETAELGQRVFEFTDEDTGVSLSAGINVFPAGTLAEVNIIENGATFTALQSALKNNAASFTAYEITFKDQDQQGIEPNGKVTVRMPIPTGYDKSKLQIYAYGSDLKKLDSLVDDEDIVFEIGSSGTFVLAQTKKVDPLKPPAGGDDEKPVPTGNSRAMMPIAVFGFVILAACICFGTVRKKRYA